MNLFFQQIIFVKNEVCLSSSHKNNIKFKGKPGGQMILNEHNRLFLVILYYRPLNVRYLFPEVTLEVR